MFETHADALPSHDLTHMLAELPIGHHDVPVADAHLASQMIEGATHLIPGRLGHASHGLAEVVQNTLHALDLGRDLHDGLVDAHHGFFHDPFRI